MNDSSVSSLYCVKSALYQFLSGLGKNLNCYISWNEVEFNNFPDKIKISGIYWVEEVGDNEVERVCELTFEVKVFGVGKLVEQFIAQSYVENQQNADAFTAAWIARELAG